MDTLKLAEDIERAGFTPAQARGLAHAIHDSAIGPKGLATKQDTAELRADMAEFRTELKTEIAELRTDIAELKAELKSDIAAIWWKIAVLLGAQLGVLVAIIELRLRLP